MTNLKCPLCETPKFYRQEKGYEGLRYHLESYHKRTDATKLIKQAKKT